MVFDFASSHRSFRLRFCLIMKNKTGETRKSWWIEVWLFFRADVDEKILRFVALSPFFYIFDKNTEANFCRFIPFIFLFIFVNPVMKGDKQRGEKEREKSGKKSIRVKETTPKIG